MTRKERGSVDIRSLGKKLKKIERKRKKRESHRKIKLDSKGKSAVKYIQRETVINVKKTRKKESKKERKVKKVKNEADK